MTRKIIDVLAIGELNVDLILNNINGFPTMGKEILAGSMLLTLGSSTAIFAANLSRLGTKVGFLGKTGSDSFGELVSKSLKGKSVDTSFLITDSKLSTGATIAMNYGNDRATVTFPGAMDHLTIEDISDKTLSLSRHIHFSSFFFQPGIRNSLQELFERAKKLGLSTSLDIQWDPEEKWDFNYQKILPLVDIFLPNEAELLNITGTDKLADAISILAPFLNTLVVKRSISGSLMRLSDGEVSEIPAYLNHDVVDAVGAGDSFNAGFIHKYLLGESLVACQDFGNLTGAVSTTKAGGTDAFNDMEEVGKLIETFRRKQNNENKGTT